MEEISKPGSGKPYDLEERTYLFAKEVRGFVKRLKRTIANMESGIFPFCFRAIFTYCFGFRHSDFGFLCAVGFRIFSSDSGLSAAFTFPLRLGLCDAKSGHDTV
jgi:hypothetical protein